MSNKDTNNLGREVKRADVTSGVAFTVLSQSGKIAINFFSSVILARILLPADFGLLAMISPVIGMALQVQSLGLTQAIVQRPTITSHQLDTLFWASIGLSAGLATLVIVAAPFLSAFFGEPRLVLLYGVASLSIILSAAAAQPTALLSRALRFKAIALRDFLASLISAIFAIAIAALTHSFWALVANQLLPPVMTLLISTRAAKWRPGRPRFDKDALDMLRFGAGVSTYNILNFLSRNLDNVIIGRFFGSFPLGLYDRAYKLLMFPLTQAVNPIGRVMLPTLSTLVGEPERYRYAFIRPMKALLAITQPGILLVIMLSDEVINLLLGSKWTQAAPIFALLGVAGLHQVFTSTLGWLYVSQGRGRDYAHAGMTVAPVTIASFFAGVPWGVTGVTTTYVISEIFFRFPFLIWHVGRHGPLTSRYLLFRILPNFAALATCWFALEIIIKMINLGDVLKIVVCAFISYATYYSVLLFFPSERRLAQSGLTVLAAKKRGRHD